MTDHEAEFEPEIFKVHQFLDGSFVFRFRRVRKLTIDPPTVIDATRHHLVGAMLNADRHPMGLRIFTGGVPGAASGGAEFCDVFEWHGASLFFRTDDIVSCIYNLT
ncbi:MAG: hypothetical protein D4R79_12340 [Comamonadaceae bacterium]|nr:MAG: hypothetical protein D4R79_12340 [Comamonadaceae bacterium]